MSRQLLSPKQVAEVLSISRASVYNHMQNGNLGSLKIGRCRRIKSTEVDKFISLQERKMRAHNNKEVA